MTAREDRRRRVLREDPGAAAQSPSAKRAKPSGERYTPAAKRDELPRLVDVVPTRMIWVFAWFTLGLISLVALGFGDYARTKYLGSLPPETLSVLSVSGYGTLASWWSGVCLLGCAVLAAVIYSIRCHRVDDYRGAYRQWMLISVCCVLASACVACPVHEAIKGLGSYFFNDGEIWGRFHIAWVLPWTLGGLILAIRALLDMRPCKSSPVFLVLAAGCYLASALGQLGIVKSERIAADVWIPGTLLAAHYALFWALCLFARYVYLDAQGELGRKKKSAKPAKSRRISKDSQTEVLRMSDSRAEARPAKRTAGDESESDPSEDQSLSLDELEVLTNPDLTRAERRKLRKKMKREQRRAA